MSSSVKDYERGKSVPPACCVLHFAVQQKYLSELCPHLPFVSGALEYKQELWTAFRSQDRGDKLLPVCSCQPKENSFTA